MPAVVGFSFMLLSYNIVYFTERVFGAYLVPYWENYYYIRSVPVFSVLFVPVFTYIAIVRYHLYDMSVVINRTLVYGSLSACVIGIYVLAVVALRPSSRHLKQLRHLALGYRTGGCSLPAA